MWLDEALVQYRSMPDLVKVNLSSIEDFYVKESLLILVVRLSFEIKLGNVTQIPSVLKDHPIPAAFLRGRFLISNSSLHMVDIDWHLSCEENGFSALTLTLARTLRKAQYNTLGKSLNPDLFLLVFMDITLGTRLKMSVVKSLSYPLRNAKIVSGCS